MNSQRWMTAGGWLLPLIALAPSFASLLEYASLRGVYAYLSLIPHRPCAVDYLSRRARLLTRSTYANNTDNGENIFVVFFVSVNWLCRRHC